MLAGKRISCGGRPLLAAGLLLLGAHGVPAGEDNGKSPTVTASPELVESREPENPEAAARAEILNSDAMLEATLWWERYFAAAAGDHEQERAELEARIAKMSAIELRKFLLEFQQERELARQRQAAFDRTRQQLTDLYLRQQQAASQAASKRPHYGSRHHFGNTQHYFGGATRPAARRRRAIWPPMITSLDVARHTIYRSVFGRRW